MSSIPNGLKYTEEHEYIRETDAEGEFLVGITDYAQGELGDVVFVELPSPGDTFDRMEVFGTIEAVKAVSDLFCPLGGEIVAVNEALGEDPALVNSDPYGEGWMVRIRARDLSELDGLLSDTDYASHLEG
ncbi:MAG: glycine cleavage system protein GcvH [Gemmatimonadota bacterium]|jgi:glycine cleavage system H protein